MPKAKRPRSRWPSIHVRLDQAAAERFKARAKRLKVSAAQLFRALDHCLAADGLGRSHYIWAQVAKRLRDEQHAGL